MLRRFIERDNLPMDNSRAENAIRLFVIDRMAWLFSDAPARANARAVIYFLAETDKFYGLEPYIWLRRVLPDLPQAKSVGDIDVFLPWNCRELDLVG